MEEIVGEIQISSTISSISLQLHFRYEN